MLLSCAPAVLAAGALPALSPGGTPSPPAFRLYGTSVVVGASEPAYVRYAAADLAEYLRAVTGRPADVAPTLARGCSRAILVGGSAAEAAGLGALIEEARGGEEFVLRPGQVGPTDCLVVAGSEPDGTKQGVAYLARHVTGRGRGTRVETIPAGVVRPSFRLRGMHLNGWAFGYPYTFRCWTEADWKRYVDILAYQGVNLLYLWPFMEIIPLPVSAEDRAYLEEVRRVVEYAQTHHGMTVWIMQAANRVARDNCGVADPRMRPYWRPSQQDLNPGDPAQFQAIMASHEALYRIVDNVDGVCTIDSDPGGYAGSPLTDYVKILRGCRELLDRLNVHGKQATLVNWMWMGWGRPAGSPTFDPAYAHTIIQAMKRDVPEPWMLIAGIPGYLEPCRQEGVLDRTVYLPYGAIEGEPSYPGTNPGMSQVRESLAVLKEYSDTAGVMGNSQCPLLQFPRTWHLLSAARALGSLAARDRESLLEVCGLLYPEHAELLADCHAALDDSEPGRPRRLARRLDALVREGRLDRPGLIGRKLFPDGTIVARALAMELRLRAAWNELCRAASPQVRRATLLPKVVELLDAYLAWDEAHGWHALWGPGAFVLGRLPADPRFAATMGNLRCALGEGTLDGFFGDVGRLLAGRHQRAYADANGVEPLAAAVRSALTIPPNLARQAMVTASVTPNPKDYPPRNAVDGSIGTLYWPGALVRDNAEWIELTWPRPVAVTSVQAYLLRHPSMWKRTLRLQIPGPAGEWRDLATATPVDTGAHALAVFELAEPARVARLRLVNLLDLFEVVVR